MTLRRELGKGLDALQEALPSTKTN